MKKYMSILIVLALGVILHAEEVPEMEWAQQFGGIDDTSNYASSSVMDNNGNVYVTGTTHGTFTEDPNKGYSDIFITKIDSQGNKVWANQIGTDYYDYVESVAVDGNGNIFITGYTSRAYENNTHIGYYDIILAKFDSYGNKLWIKQFGTTKSDYGRSITIDANNNVYVGGNTFGTFGNNYDKGRGDAYLAKYDNDGTKIWAKQFGSYNFDNLTSLAIDENGDILTAGYSGSSTNNYNAFITKFDKDGSEIRTNSYGTRYGELDTIIRSDKSGNIYLSGRTYGSFIDATKLSSTNVYIMKISNTDGAQVWVQEFATTSAYATEYLTSLALDSLGNIYVGGYTYGRFENVDNIGGTDAFVVKYDSNGSKVLTKRYGTQSTDQLYAVMLDNEDNIYLSGYTYGSLDSEDTSKNYDIFVTKFDKSMNQIWIEQFGGTKPSSDYAKAVSIDSSDNAYVVGYTNGSLPGNTGLGDEDAFVSKYDKDGSREWVKQFGTSNRDRANDVVVDKNGFIYVVGYTFDTFSDNSSAGGTDSYVAKFDQSGNQIWIKQFGTFGVDAAFSIAVDNTDGVYVSGVTNGEFDGFTYSDPDQKYDAFVVKFDDNGNQQWVQQYQARQDRYSQAQDIVADKENNVYVLDKSYGYEEGVFIGRILISKFNSNGSLLAANRYGKSGTASPYPYSISSDGSNIYVGGYVYGAFEDNNNSGSYGPDAFLMKVDHNGNQLWVNQFGTEKYDYIYAVATDNSGTTYVSGKTKGIFPGNEKLGSNDYDAYLAKIDTNGDRLWVYQYGTSSSDISNGVAIGSSVYTTGYTYGALTDNLSAGFADIFLAKFVGDTVAPLTLDVTLSQNVLAVGEAYTISATIDDTTTGASTIQNTEYSINGGEWKFMNPLDGDFDTSSEYVETEVQAPFEAGVYEVCVRGTDSAGNVNETPECTYVVAYDPNGGFVTGGGWIDSPEGAYKLDETLVGKASFGFVSKYKKGASVPTGNTEFQFKSANFNFKSDSYSWLVVTGNDYAKFKGVGSINGEGSYQFMIWAGDDTKDTFRIKIWNENSDGSEDIVYDNGVDQTIRAGSIVVHTSKK